MRLFCCLGTKFKASVQPKQAEPADGESAIVGLEK